MNNNFESSGGESPELQQHRENMARIRKTTENLGEHFDCVVVLAHIVDKNKCTVSRYAHVCGDPLAAQQAATLFVNENMARAIQGSGNNAL